MRDLNYELKRLGERNRDGSFATQANRWHILKLCADQLHELGYHKLHAHELKGRHVQALVQRWQREALSVGTIKNRLAALRWWAEKVGRTAVMARGNDYYGLSERETVAQASKAQTLDGDILARVSCPYVRLSLELQREFGLRREEAMKFQPNFADRGDHLVLKDSWTKGGRPRVIPLTQASQREVLNRAHQLAGKGSFIPPQLTYVQQLKRFERQTANAGLSKTHGLRHRYAQTRYRELVDARAQERLGQAGWEAPTAGGPTSRELTPEQKAIDREVRLLLTEELGHRREQITTAYLGR